MQLDEKSHLASLSIRHKWKNIKICELTKHHIDQIEQMIAQDCVVHWELNRGERVDIEQLFSISQL